MGNRGSATVHEGRRLGVKESTADALVGWLFILPVVGGTLVFEVLPMFPAYLMSLTAWDGFGAMQWRGLDNYSVIFHDTNFYRSLLYTVQYVVGAVPLGLVMGFLLALLVNQKMRGVTVFRGIFYLPVVSSIVAVAVVFQYLLSPQFGLINMLLYNAFGIIGPRWLQEPGYAMSWTVFLSVWTGMGYNMVLFLAGLQGIPVHLYEAATIDGAGAWRKLRHVTVPLITPTFFLVSIIGVIAAFNVFSLVMVFTGGNEYNGTRVLFVYLYQEALIRLKFGLGSALAVIMFFGVAALTLVNWKLGQRYVFYG